MAKFDAFPEFRFEDDEIEENEWLVKERIDVYLANGGSVSPLIRFFTSFRIMGASDKEHLMLQGWAKLFSWRNRNEDDEGLKIYNVDNREDCLFGLSYLIFTRRDDDGAQYVRDVMPAICLAIGDVNPDIQSCACKSLSRIALIRNNLVRHELSECFGSIFEALLIQCKTTIDGHRPAIEDVVALQTNLSNLVAKVDVHPGSLQVFIQHFDRLGDTRCHRTRRFLIKWLLILLTDDMLRDLPVILAGLFNMTRIPPTTSPQPAPDASLFTISIEKSLAFLRSFRKMFIKTAKFDLYLSANVANMVYVVARYLQKPPREDAEAKHAEAEDAESEDAESEDEESEDEEVEDAEVEDAKVKAAEVEAMEWASTLIEKFPREVLDCPEFKTLFLEDVEMPEAHFLMGLKLATRGSDFELASSHLFKAINYVKEATIAMAIVAIFSEKHEVAKVFSSMTYSGGWEEVSSMTESLLSKVSQIKKRSSSATFNVMFSECSTSHTIGSRCERCYMYLCAIEFAKLINQRKKAKTRKK